jgi:galactokinase
VIRAFAPGRVNLIGDHTDYTGGLVLPLAINLGTTVEGSLGGSGVRLTSDDADEKFDRYVQAVASVVGVAAGFTGRVSTTLPIGAGLSSSAALEVSVALALGFKGSALALALACQAAEQQASGVPCGIMDQLASAAGVEGHALLIDCASFAVEPVPLPDAAEIVVVHSGQPRALAGSAYAERRAACEAAETVIGPLRSASAADVDRLDDPVLQARARHVVSENQRVRDFADALRAGDLSACGRLMLESHRSLAADFEVSTPALDSLVSTLADTADVFGARLTGAGFGGCVVALCRPGALAGTGWHVRAVDGARLLDG